MGRYTDWDKVTRRFPDFAKGISADVAEDDYIAAAEAELDGRLSPSYLVPFCNTPTLAPAAITDLATDLTYIKAVGRRTKNGGPISADFEARIKRILKGSELLYIQGTLLPPLTSGGGWSSTQVFGSSFGMDDPINWEIDGSAISASETKRSG